MQVRWVGSLALVALAGLSWMVQPRLDACGPGFAEAVFQDTHQPDTTWSEAVRGKVGILRPGLPMDHLVIAYRHLMGLPVDVDAWDPKPIEALSKDPEPYRSMEKRWQAAVSKALGSVGAKPLDTTRNTGTFQWFSNVSDHAIHMALATWKDRCMAYGEKDPMVLAWLKAQDQVFRSTPKEPGIPEPVASPEWLSKDRDYQRAAALFYSDRWADARAGFLAISKDAHSPWRAWGGFLVARCWIREASLGPDAEARSRLTSARTHLESLLKDPAFSSVHEVARDYLEFVRYRLEPELLHAEALEGLAGERSKPGWLEQLKQSARRIEPAAVPAGTILLSASAKDLREWLEVMRSSRPSEERVTARWRSAPSLPWLVAGLAVLPADHGLRPELDAMAAQVPRTHPAWISLHWHQIRSGVEAAAPHEVPFHVQSAMKEPWPAWAENVLRAQGRAHARTLEEWATWAGSKVAGVKDSYSPPASLGELPEGTAKRYGQDPQLLEPEAARSLNAHFPLKNWVALAEAGGLSSPLRQDVAHTAWVRAILLQDWDAERRLRIHLDHSMKQLIPNDLATLAPEIREFRLVQILMANPGLSPLVAEGLGRSNYGWVPLTETVNFGTNWWCLPSPKEGSPKPVVPFFVTREDLGNSEAEWGRLRKFSSARHWFGRTVLAYAETHPLDPSVPQSLHRFVRITRNAECADKGLSSLSRQAFRNLHHQYPNSAWTKRTPVYY